MREIRLIQGDCMDIMKSIPSGSVDLLLQDPPYFVTQNEWDKPIDLQTLWPEWLRIAKPNAAFVFTAQQPFATDLIMSNRKLFRYDLIWYKALGSGFLNANRMPMRNHEHILVFYRSLPTYNPQMGNGNRKKGVRKHDRTGTNYGSFATQSVAEYFDNEGKRHPQSVIDFTNGDRQNESDHPTQKPLSLWRYLIRTYSNPGELVFDGYGGSGTTAISAYDEGRAAVVSELDPDYHAQSVKRFNTHKQQLQLFQ